MEVMDLTKIVAKWNARTSVATAEYEDGVRSPKKDWAAAASAAETTFEEGIRDAINRKAFGKGVKAAGTAYWQERTLTLGVPRWPQGVAESQDRYRTNIEPFMNALRALTLPQRYAKGDARNIQRVTVIAAALHKLKMQRA